MNLLFTLFTLVTIAVVNVWVYCKLSPLRDELRDAQESIEEETGKIAAVTEELTALAGRHGFDEAPRPLQPSRVADEVLGSVSRRTLEAIAQLSRFADSCPGLRADQTYQRLMDDLNRLAAETQPKYADYNRRAKVYNTALTGFPAGIVAGLLGFANASYLYPTRWHPEPEPKAAR